MGEKVCIQSRNLGILLLIHSVRNTLVCFKGLRDGRQPSTETAKLTFQNISKLSQPSNGIQTHLCIYWNYGVAMPSKNSF